MKTIRFTFLISILIFNFQNTFSQGGANNRIEVVPAPPEAAALTKVLEYPISSFSGVPDISVPLYTINYKDISVPLTLSYHSGGFKVTEEASWVGLGWTLNPAGVVTKTIRGKDDSHSTHGFQNSPETFDMQCVEGGGLLTKWHGCSGNAALGITATIKGQYLNLYKDGVVVNYSDDIAYGYDWEPDLYSFNFSGYSGQFIIDRDGNPFLFEQKDVLIKEIPGGWKFITPEGFQYEFLASAKTSDGLGLEVSSAWYLTKITSPAKSEMNFSYQASEWIHTQNSLYEYDEEKYLFGPANSVSQISGSSYKEQYLSSVNFGEGHSILFNKSSRDDIENGFKLDNIVITNSRGLIIKEFEFETSYFISPNESVGNQNYSSSYLYEYAGKRLKLDRVTEKNGTFENPPYEFFYNSTKLPYKTSYAQDYWGYYNNKFNHTLIPNIQDVLLRDGAPYWFEYDGANRTPDSTFMKACILEKIIYPTGGETKFDFESNTYSNTAAIENRDWDDITKQAVKMENMSGNTSYTGDITFNIPNNLSQYTCEMNLEVACLSCTFGFTSSMYADIITSSGIKRYYFDVLDDNDDKYINISEKLSGTKGDVTLHIEMPNSGDQKIATLTFKYRNVNYKDLKIGGGLRCKKITRYDGNNHDNDIIVDYIYHHQSGETELSYGRHKVPIKHIYPMRNYSTFDDFGKLIGYGFSNNLYFGVSFGNSAYIGYDKIIRVESGNGSTETSYYNDEYSFMMGADNRTPGLPTVPFWKHDSKLKSQTYFSEDGEVLKSSNYFYKSESSIFPSLTTTYSTDGEGTNGIPKEHVSTINYYPIYSNLVQLEYQIETLYTNQGQFNTRTDFEYNHKNLQVSKTSVDYNKGDKIVTENYYTVDYAQNASEVIDNMISEDYHMTGVIIETVSKVNSQIIGGTYNKYNELSNGSFMPTSIYHLETQNPIEEITFNNSKDNVSASPDTRYAERQVFSYYENGDSDNANIKAYRKPGDVNTSFLWSYNGQFPVVKGVGIDQPELAIAVGNAINTLASYSNGINDLNNFYSDISGLDTQSKIDTWKAFNSALRVQPELVASLVSTYCYEPLYGICSLADPNGIITYYEYDKMGRLKLIKDADGNILQNYQYHYKGQ